jgi:hypothetical protein
MKNPTRRLDDDDYELLLSALRTHGRFLAETLRTEAMMLSTRDPFGRGIKDALRTEGVKMLASTRAMYDRLCSLKAHDSPLEGVPDEARTFCLGCRRRHVPHCGSCGGCLPEELPE